MAITTGTKNTRKSSSTAITYVVVNRFQGGITAQADKVQIPNGMTPMSRNVEWREVGGIVGRQGVGPLQYGDLNREMAALGDLPLAFYHYVQDPSNVSGFRSQYLVSCASGKIMVGVDYGAPVTGVAVGAWGVVNRSAVPVNTIGPAQFAAWDTSLYITPGTQSPNSLGAPMVKWTGNNSVTDLGSAFNDDIANPVGGNMPPARYIAMWAERTWTAVHLHGASIDASRIRWSHPGKPEDWRTADYIDVGQQGDVITGIAPMRDMLIVFKRNSTYALLGSGATNFRVVEVSGTIGCTGQWTRDNQGSVIFYDASVGVCRFDGKEVTNIFQPLRQFFADRPPSITRCGSIVTDGDKVYVLTDFTDAYGARIPDPVHVGTQAAPLDPGRVTWQSLKDNGMTWEILSAYKWLTTAYSFYNLVWVYRPGCGWTSFTLQHPTGKAVTMLGQLRSRLAPTGSVDSNRRIVYGIGDPTATLFGSDRYDDGYDHFENNVNAPIDSFYMTSWLTAGLAAQIKRFKAPRVIQEAEVPGTLLIDVYYDYNYDFLRRTLRVQVVPNPIHPYSNDSYVVNKPGTIGRAKAALLVIRPEAPRHWGVSSITIPVHPKVLR